MTKKHSAIKIITNMIFISLLGKILGLIREILFAKNFGTTNISGTAFNYASNIPNQFLDIMFASAINSSFIPIFNREFEKKNKQSAFELLNNFLSLILLISTIASFFMLINSNYIINFLASGLNIKTKILASQLLKILSPILIFSSITSTFSGVLQSFDEFNIPALTSTVFNLIIILYYIFFINKFGVYGLAFSFLIGWLFQILIQLPFLYKQKYKFHFNINLKSNALQDIFKLLIPVLISSWVMPINNIINSSFASYIIGGGNALRIANTVYIIITGTFVLSLNNFVFQRLSKLKANNLNQDFTHEIKNALENIFFFLLPLTFILLIFNREIISILFERGNFDANSTNLTSRALFFYSFGIIGYGVQVILNSGFYADKNGKIPLISSLIGVILNFIFSFISIKFLNIGGPALASSLSITFTAFFMLFISQKNNNQILDKTILFRIIKIFLASTITYLIIFVLHDLFFINLTLSRVNKFLFLCTINLFALLFYFFISYLLKLPQALFIKNLIHKKKA